MGAVLLHVRVRVPLFSGCRGRILNKSYKTIVYKKRFSPIKGCLRMFIRYIL